MVYATTYVNAHDLGTQRFLETWHFKGIFPLGGVQTAIFSVVELRYLHRQRAHQLPSGDPDCRHGAKWHIPFPFPSPLPGARALVRKGLT